MARQRSDSRDKIVESARTLLRRQGYHGTGLAQVIEVSGAPRGSVYYLFPGGKEEIAVAAVAASLLCCLEGALVLCRVQQSTEPLRQIVEQILVLVAHHTPAREPAG